MITTPGLYPDLADAYHAAPSACLTQSGIKTLLSETPYDYKNPTPRKSKEMDFGSVVHALTLGKGKSFSICPFDDYKTKAAREWKVEQEAEGLIPIKVDRYNDAMKIASRLQFVIANLTQGHDYQTEVPFYWQEGETWCSGMADVWVPELLLCIDPKVTARVARPAPQMINYGWDIQAAWYTRGLTAIHPEHAGRIRFVNVLIKPQEPFTHRIVTIGEAWRHSAEQECLRALRIFQRCTAEDKWPAWGDEIEQLDAPSWALSQRQLAGMEDETDAA